MADVDEPKFILHNVVCIPPNQEESVAIFVGT